jgi:hypothetical protein
MLSNRLAFAGLAIACVAAAAGGGYFATRQNAVPVPASAAIAPQATSAAPAAAPLKTTQSTQPADATAADAPQKKTPAAPEPAAAPKNAREKVSARLPEPTATRAPRATGQVARRDQRPMDRIPSDNSVQTQAPPPAPLPTIAGTLSSDPAAFGADDRADQEPPPSAEPQRLFEELTVPSDSVVGLQIDSTISSEHARVEDRVDGRVTRDVRVNNRVAIPAGTRAIGAVTLVERGGKFKERARLGIRFNTLVLADGTRQAISTETIYREGEPPASAPKVGAGAVGGAILGAILGGGKGAVIGGMAGAGAGSAAVMAGDRNAAVLQAGTTMTVRVIAPVTVTIGREKEY